MVHDAECVSSRDLDSSHFGQTTTSVDVRGERTGGETLTFVTNTGTNSSVNTHTDVSRVSWKKCNNNVTLFLSATVTTAAVAKNGTAQPGVKTVETDHELQGQPRQDHASSQMTCHWWFRVGPWLWCSSYMYIITSVYCQRPRGATHTKVTKTYWEYCFKS